MLYHGTSQEFTALEAGDGSCTDVQDENVASGVFLTTSEASAANYADRAERAVGGEARVLTVGLAEGVKLVEYSEELEVLFSDDDAGLVDWALSHGYDGIDFEQGGIVNDPGTVLVFDPDNLTILN